MKKKIKNLVRTQKNKNHLILNKVNRNFMKLNRLIWFREDQTLMLAGVNLQQTNHRLNLGRKGIRQC